MGKIAHLKVTCPQCGQYTSIYVEERGSDARVKCEHCKQIFEFGKGMMYEPVAYVPSIPSWAVIRKSDEVNVFSQAEKCGKCGYEYTESDSSLHYAFSKTASESDSSFDAMLLNNPAFKNLLGVKVLYKCGSCSKIACSDCAPESTGITRKKCPFCKSDYTIYSEIKPTVESLSSGNGTNIQHEVKPSVSKTVDVKTENEIVKNKRPTAITVICILGFIGAAFTIVLLFTDIAEEVGDWYPPYLTLTSILGFVCMVGLWQMKKWAAYTYTGLVGLNQIVLLAMGVWGFGSIFIPAIVVGIALSNVKKMNGHTVSEPKTLGVNELKVNAALNKPMQVETLQTAGSVNLGTNIETHIKTAAIRSNISKVVFVREDRNDLGTFLTYKGPSKADAMAFLSEQSITQPSYYVVVETPDGNYGKDIQGFYQE